MALLKELSQLASLTTIAGTTIIVAGTSLTETSVAAPASVIINSAPSVDYLSISNARLINTTLNAG